MPRYWDPFFFIQQNKAFLQRRTFSAPFSSTTKQKKKEHKCTETDQLSMVKIFEAETGRNMRSPSSLFLIIAE